MSKKLLYFKLLSLFLLSNVNVNAQNSPTWTCSADEVQEEIFRQNPELKKIYETKQAEFLNFRKSELKGQKQLKANQIIEIPTVVHILDDGTGKYIPTEVQVKNWIDYTNGLYANTYYQNNASVNYPFRLVLAQRTEDNKPTNGIIRLNYSNDTKYTTHGVNNETNNGYDAQDLIKTSFWDPNSYYNVYVFNKFD